MIKLEELKTIIKDSAISIKNNRKHLREEQRSQNPGSSTLQRELYFETRTHRHRLIAYGELLGHERDEIEKPRENNLPSERLIAAIKDRFAQDEIIHIAA